jgi:hypothetical protein
MPAICFINLRGPALPFFCGDTGEGRDLRSAAHPEGVIRLL